ncbi:MAG TPA: methyltransferase domain-containing protein [Ilumatobacteraceae bacterium]|nr:methyltransferase domain-containing protein [Ilumatobacteraceae bacterium]
MTRYAFEFTWDSTYGIAARMLDDTCGPGLVLDLGCGEGTFAQPIHELGREYLGVELDEGSVERCRAAGLDVHLIDLADPDVDAVHDRLVDLVAGRPVAAVSMLDVIEHLVDPERVFTDLGRLLARLGGAHLVVSIPNVSHIDIASKLLLGRWDVTATGLLDSTHVTYFDADHLERVTGATGFVELERRDKQMTVTEQEFPLDHPAITRATTFRQFTELVRAQADEHRDTYQFVRAYRHDPTTIVASEVESVSTPPFCSVLVRTQGGRASLDDALTCLAAQTDRDIEVLLAVHAEPAVVTAVQGLVDRYAPSFRSQVRVLTVEGDGRSAGLNLGLAAARGRYLTFLDDDDIVTANWIEEFRAAHDAAPGTVLRAQCVVQEHRRTLDARIDYEPVGGFDAPFNREFDLVQHRQLNQTPICAWAVPMGAVRALHLRFDEQLPVCEDWEFLVRAAELLGVSNRDAFTSIYRRFTDGWGSVTTIQQQIWDDTALAIRLRLDARPTLVPAGSIEPIARLREQAAALSAAHANALARIEALERSRYWRMTAPLRWLTSRRGPAISHAKARVRAVANGRSGNGSTPRR